MVIIHQGETRLCSLLNNFGRQLRAFLFPGTDLKSFIMIAPNLAIPLTNIWIKTDSVNTLRVLQTYSTRKSGLYRRLSVVGSYVKYAK